MLNMLKPELDTGIEYILQKKKSATNAHMQISSVMGTKPVYECYTFLENFVDIIMFAFPKQKRRRRIL
jgi:hypothetical protein